LHVVTADAIWAFELGHQATTIATRLGVKAVRFAPGQLPVAEQPPVPRHVPQPTDEQDRAATEIAGMIEEPDLRETVREAVRLALARSAATRPI
jgi:hypothetical protein